MRGVCQTVGCAREGKRVPVHRASWSPYKPKCKVCGAPLVPDPASERTVQRRRQALLRSLDPGSGEEEE
jgi:hypothetical protein